MEKRLYVANAARNAHRQATPVHKCGPDSIISMNRSQVSGTLASNLERLQELLPDPHLTAENALHYKAISEVGTFILENGPLVKTHLAGDIYLKTTTKNL